MVFLTGYYNLHRDIGMKFQMNPWYGCVDGPATLDEMRIVARASTGALQNFSRGHQKMR